MAVSTDNKTRCLMTYSLLETVEKALEGEGKPKHRYLKGITSGTKIDGQGERITDKCLQSLQAQGKAGTVLLYADRHGVAYTEDIGILVDCEITSDDDWVCTFRLYDESDGVPQACLDTIEKLWKQMNGLPPYKAKLQKGFSIEGFIPQGGILSTDSEGRRVIDAMDLDGAVVVPRPAYTSSIASAIYKSLGENSPWVEQKIMKAASEFKTTIATEELSNSYFKFNYKYQDKLQEIVETIMRNPSVRDKKSALEKVLKEYSDAMIELVLSSKDVFNSAEKGSQSEDFQYLYAPSADSRMSVLKALLAQVNDLETILTK